MTQSLESEFSLRHVAAVSERFPDIDRGAASQVRVLLPTGYGLNCEAETRAAFACLGARVDMVHVADLLDSPSKWLTKAAIVAFVGGFAFGDHVASGRVLANRLRFRAGAEFGAFVADGGLAIGMCNGFQIMAKLGVLPGPKFGESPDLADLSKRSGTELQPVSVVANRRRGYRNAWVRLLVDAESPCVFTRGMAELRCPSRHGEGRIVFASSEVRERLEGTHAVPLRYADEAGQSTEAWPANPNGSEGGIAGLCDPTGRVFGMMPHAEAYLYAENLPNWQLQRERGQLQVVGQGLELFANGIRAALAT